MNNQTKMITTTEVMATAAATEDERNATGLPSTEAAISILILQVPMVAMSIYVHLLVLKMLKREKFSFGGELRIYCILNILSMPVLAILLNGLTIFMYPAADMIGVQFCYITETLTVVNMFNVIVHSLIMALYKYVHTAHSELVRRVGATRVRIAISSIGWTYILIATVVHMVNEKPVDPMFWSNWCYGRDNIGGFEHQVENTFWNRAKVYLCMSDNYGVKTRFGTASSTTAGFLQGMCFVSLVSGTIILCNIVDAVLYYKLYKHINR